MNKEQGQFINEEAQLEWKHRKIVQNCLGFPLIKKKIKYTKEKPSLINNFLIT